MSKKLSRIRLKNLADALYRAQRRAERYSTVEDPLVAEIGKRMDGQLDDMIMEIAVLLADDEDGTRPLSNKSL